MSDEQTTETTQQTETKTETKTEKEVTLDDVYRDAGLDKAVTETQQQTQRTEQQQQTKVEPSSIPDPYDAENFKAYLARQAAGTTELQKAVVEVTRFLTAQQQREAMQTTKADIDKAVGTINEVVQHPKPKVIEAALDGMVREDPRLKAIWENRGKNPVAWGNALKIVTKQISEDFSNKVDPKLVEAQRARREAQKQMATTSPEAPDESWEGLSQADFDRRWQQLTSGGN